MSIIQRFIHGIIGGLRGSLCRAWVFAVNLFSVLLLYHLVYLHNPCRPILKQVSRNDPKATEVSFENLLFPKPEQMVRVVHALKQNRHVQTVDFRNAVRTPEMLRGLAALFRENSVIRHAQLPSHLSNQEFCRIAESLYANTTITELHLRECDINGRVGGEVIRTLLSRNKTITELNLYCNALLKAEGVSGIARALRSSSDHGGGGCCCALIKLSLFGCFIQDDGVRDVAKALWHNSVLKELDLSHNMITYVGFGLIAEMLAYNKNSSLEALSLESNYLEEHRRTGLWGKKDETVGDLLVRVLRKNTRLRGLNISNCGLSKTDLYDVFAALAGKNSNQTLSQLCIEMDEDAIGDFAHFLPDMKGLKVMRFTWYPLSTAALRKLLEGLRDNKSLLSIEAPSQELLSPVDDVLDKLWRTLYPFYTCRNRMTEIVVGSGGRQRPVPPGLWPHLLNNLAGRAHRYEPTQLISAKVHASLIFHVLSARTSDIFALKCL